MFCITLYFQQVQTLMLALHISWELHSLNVMSACGFPFPIPKPALMSVVCWLLVLSSCSAAWCPVLKINFFPGGIPGIARTPQGSLGLFFPSEDATLQPCPYLPVSLQKAPWAGVNPQQFASSNSDGMGCILTWNDFTECCSEKLIKIADFCVSLLFNTWYLDSE